MRQTVLSAITKSSNPGQSHRVIPSRFPPVKAFETITDVKDLDAVIELEGWTNDRLVKQRFQRLPEQERIYGRPNASIALAAFLHASPNGQRFSTPDLGAWYASKEEKTALLEVLNNLRREVAQSALSQKTEEFRQYLADLSGEFYDITEGFPDFHNPTSYVQSQPFGERVRASGAAGIIYNSVRHESGINYVSYRPSKILNIRQGHHWRAHVRETGKVFLEKLSA